METNGTLCTPELSQELAAGKNPFVSVSLDGADKETHEWVRGREGCFQKALEGIRNLVEAGLKPQIIMTLMRRNKDQIEEVIRLAQSLGAGSVKFNILQPTARGKKMHEEGEALDIEELVSLGQRVENELSVTTYFPLFNHHPLAFSPLGRLFGNDGSGCNTCRVLKILGVLSDGSYALCGIGETVPELIFGHAERDHLSDVWNDTPILMELRNGIPHRFEGICKDCLLKGICLGSCLAQNYYTHKNLWSGFWYCERANQKGLFPESRRREGKEEIQ
jgi:SynChlorMet cassette radical SAM/SPASM protein ScmF